MALSGFLFSLKWFLLKSPRIIWMSWWLIVCSTYCTILELCFLYNRSVMCDWYMLFTTIYLPCLPVYKSTPHFGTKSKFFLFLVENFLEKIILYLRTFFQACYSYTKKITASLDIKFYYHEYASVKACFNGTSINCIFFIFF